MVSWLDAIERRAREAIGKPDEPKPAPRIAAPRQPAPEIRSVWVQTCRPRGDGDPGGAEAAFYFLADGMLTLCDRDGKPSKSTHTLSANDDERRIAGRLFLAAWNNANSDFNRPLNYQRGSYA